MLERFHRSRALATLPPVTPAALLWLATAADAVVHDTPMAAEAPDPVVDTRPPRVEIVVPAVHGLALMSVMRATEAYLWPDPFARPQWFGAHYEEAFSQPPIFDASKPFMRWDGDPLVVNAVGHGLFGSELYLRARQCRLGWAGALAFAAGTSALWEYGFEANGVRPSAQDLVYTPLMGLLLGEARYQIHRAAGSIRGAAARGVVRGVVDPLGELERVAGTDC